jgi:hypothetical protein
MSATHSPLRLGTRTQTCRACNVTVIFHSEKRNNCRYLYERNSAPRLTLNRSSYAGHWGGNIPHFSRLPPSERSYHACRSARCYASAILIFSTSGHDLIHDRRCGRTAGGQPGARTARADSKTHTGTPSADLLVGTLAFASANMHFSAQVIGRSGWWPGYTSRCERASPQPMLVMVSPPLPVPRRRWRHLRDTLIHVSLKKVDSY